MRLRDAQAGWGSVTKLLHWSVAVLILVLMVLGWLAALAPLSPAKITLFYWHKSIGMLVLLLVLARLGWRTFNRPPALPAELPRWEPRMARAAHATLYLLILLMPLSGWALSSASGIPFKIFWVVPVPSIAPVSGPLETALQGLHLALFWALGIAVAGHVGASLRHEFILRNRVLSGMLPRLPGRPR